MKLLIILLFLYSSAADEINLQNIQVPDVDIDDFDVIREKCEKNGGLDAYEKLKSSKDTLQTCITQFANASTFKNEIEAAKKTGSMDEVFAKYCAKRPQLASCLKGFIDTIRKCLNNEENKALNVTLDLVKQLGEFGCYRDGDRIAMFIAEGGIECIKDRTEGIKQCVNSTFKIEPTTVTTTSLPQFLIDSKKCNDFGKLQTCIVDELEKCEDSTPANIIDALFKFIKRTACGSKPKRDLSFHRLIKRSLSSNNALFRSDLVIKQLQGVFKEKCKQNAPDGGFEAVTLSLESAVECMNKPERKTFSFIIRANASTIKNTLKICFERVIEKSEACLNDNEKYWPRFTLDTLYNLIDFFYENKKIFNTLPTVEVYSCLLKFKEEKTRNEMQKCFPIEAESNLEKSHICSKLKNMKDCFMNVLNKNCIKDAGLQKLADDYFIALLKSCNKSSNK